MIIVTKFTNPRLLSIKISNFSIYERDKKEWVVEYFDPNNPELVQTTVFIGEDAEEKARWFARTEYGIIEAINIEDIPAYALAEQQNAVPKIQNSDGLQ